MSILTNDATISATNDKYQTIDTDNMEEKPSFTSSSILDVHNFDTLLYSMHKEMSIYTFIKTSFI